MVQKVERKFEFTSLRHPHRINSLAGWLQRRLQIMRIRLTADEHVFELPVGFGERLHARIDLELQGTGCGLEATKMSRARCGARHSQLQPERESE